MKKLFGFQKITSVRTCNSELRLDILKQTRKGSFLNHTRLGQAENEILGSSAFLKFNAPPRVKVLAFCM